MFRNKVSILVIFMMVCFLGFNIFGYFLLKDNLIQTNQDKNKIIFYKSKLLSSNLIDKLIYEYAIQKNSLIKKHLEVQKYLENIRDFKSLDLKNIYKKINKGLESKPYNIYISDEKLIIENTTFKDDLGFDLTFAKEIFDKHKKENVLVASAPNFENTSKRFFSYTDSYIKDTKRILQVSYTYPHTKNLLNEIKNLILDNENLIKSNAFVMFKNGYIENFIFDGEDKVSSKVLKNDSQKAKKLIKKLKNNSFLIQKEGQYKKVYFLGESEVFPSNKILFYLVFDDSFLYKKLAILKYITFTLLIFGLLFIYYVFLVRDKEILLNQKDEFIRCSMHEIKTPLNIIALNNQLRDKICGLDKYSQRISSSIKTLQNSYEDMAFFLTQNRHKYKKESINLKEFLEKRISFFDDLAKVQNKKLILDYENRYIYISISEIELIRLIDNNLSNAIKYSQRNSTIKVILEKNTLYFKSKSDAIKDTKKIFKTYERENNSSGGQGLGLSIVKSICEKYDILVEVYYEDGYNVFKYTFCHFSDTDKL